MARTLSRNLPTSERSVSDCTDNSPAAEPGSPHCAFLTCTFLALKETRIGGNRVGGRRVGTEHRHLFDDSQQLGDGGGVVAGHFTDRYCQAADFGPAVIEQGDGVTGDLDVFRQRAAKAFDPEFLRLPRFSDFAALVEQSRRSHDDKSDDRNEHGNRNFGAFFY